MLLLPDGRRDGVGLGGRAEGAEPVSRVDHGLVGQCLGEFVRRGVLMAYEGVGVVGTQQVGPPGRAVQQ